jgi:hypothetical protein
MDPLTAASENAQIAIIILAFVGILVAIWGLLSLLIWGVGKLGLFRRARRRFDALDDAVDEELSEEDRFRLDVALHEGKRGHDPSTR